MLSKNAFEKTGGYDENIFLYCEETVLGKKIKDNDLKTVVLSKYNYTHYHGVTINKNIKSIVKRQKTLIRSHHYVLKKYLHANSVESFFDRIVCFISLMECVIKQLIHIE